MITAIILDYPKNPMIVMDYPKSPVIVDYTATPPKIIATKLDYPKSPMIVKDYEVRHIFNRDH